MCDAAVMCHVDAGLHDGMFQQACVPEDHFVPTLAYDAMRESVWKQFYISC